MGLNWKLHRLRVLAGSITTRIDWTADLDDPKTWTALSETVATMRLPQWAYLPPDGFAQSLAAVGPALSDPAALESAVEIAYRTGADLWEETARTDGVRPEWVGEVQLQAFDDGLEAALAKTTAPGRTQREIAEGLLRAVRSELGRSTAHHTDSPYKLASKLLRRVARIQGQTVQANRLTLVWSVLVPLFGSKSHPPEHERADKVLALFDANGLPDGFAQAGVPEGLFGGATLWAVVLETQVADYKGLPFSSKAGRACWKSKDKGLRADVLVGIAQLAAGKFSGRILFEEALIKGLTALAERTSEPDLVFTDAHQVELDACPPPRWLQTHIDPVALNTMGRAPDPEAKPKRTRKAKRTLEPEVRGLRGGTLLWPLLEEVLDDRTWVSWRSHPDSAEALMKAPKTYAGHVKVGIAQLTRDPERFGVPENRREDVKRVLSGFALKRKRWIGNPPLDDADQAVLDALP